MEIFTGDDINKVYEILIRSVDKEGDEFTKSNGTTIKEIVPATIKISNPAYGILTHSNRSYNPAFAIAECLWNLTGDTREWLADYNEKYRKYFKNGLLKAGYGNRIMNGVTNQIDEVIKLLKEQPDTSRATISIFNPTHDYKKTNFVPCISFLKFRILTNKQNSKLYMWAFMRAQDIWKGFPYDINLLLSIFQLIANQLDIEMGCYYHVCDTIRLYKDDANDIQKFLYGQSSTRKPMEIVMFDSVQDNYKVKLCQYRDLIMKNDDFNIKEIEDILPYWRNNILICWTYKKIKNKAYKEANNLYSMMDSDSKELIKTWSKRYNNRFYEYLNDIYENSR